MAFLGFRQNSNFIIYVNCKPNREPRVYPILHLDMHGTQDKSGLSLSPSGDEVSWIEFAELCRKINLECQNNLFVTMGLCHGFNAIKKVGMSDLTPYYALIGIQDLISAGELDVGFPAFYKKLLLDSDIDSAMSLLVGDFRLFLSEKTFIRGYANYVHDACQGKGRQDRIDELLTRVLDNNPSQKGHISDIRKVLEDKTRPDPVAFERYKKQFLMSDHPDNRNRFNADFDDMMDFVSSLQD